MKHAAAAVAALISLAAVGGCGDPSQESTMSLPPQPTVSRAPPPEVPAVSIDGLSYQQVAGDPDTDGQVGGMLAAFGPGGQELWRLKIYDNQRRADLEGDVQDVWFRSMQARDGKLLIENERGERFEVDPASRRVVQSRAAASDPQPGIDPISGEKRIPRPR